MPSYTRLTLADREEISRKVAQGVSVRIIARLLGRNPSTVSREIRGTSGVPARYRAVEAHRQAEERAGARRRGGKLDRNPALRAVVFAKLTLRWSPEQIAQWLKRTYPLVRSMHVSHETIYASLYVLPRGALKRELLSSLRQQRRYRRMKRKGTGVPETRGKIPDMVSIEERPSEVAGRTVPGHWEGDLLLGKWKQSALGTLVERMTRTTILVPLRKGKDAPAVRTAFAREMRTLPKQIARSLTYDQGKEMAEHTHFTKATTIKVYFAHPGSPWERGTNEHTNGLIRQFFPKGTDFSKIPRLKIKRVQSLLNGRPRKVLNWRTPSEVFHEVLR